MSHLGRADEAERRQTGSREDDAAWRSRSASDAAQHARERKTAEETLKQLRDDLADAHACRETELRERAQIEQQMTEQVSRLAGEVATLRQTAACDLTLAVTGGSRRFGQPAPHAGQLRSLLCLVKNSPSASSALAVIAGKQKRSLLHVDMVTREVREMGLGTRAIQRDVGRWAFQEYAWPNCRRGSSSSSSSSSSRSSDSHGDCNSDSSDSNFTRSKGHKIQFSSRQRGVSANPAVSTVRALLR